MDTETYKELKAKVMERVNGQKLSMSKRIFVERQIFEILPQFCEKCGRKENLTLDHIIPIYLLECFNVNPLTDVVEDNYRILCYSCNKIKSNRLDFTTPKTKEILTRLLATM